MTAQSSLLPKSSLQILLDKIRATARDEHAKGHAFEQLCLRYLQEEPQYKTLYKQVERYVDWAVQHNLVIQRDIGIDLVATTYNGEQHAVQCKCYLPGHIINKKDMDSFISATADKAFSECLLIDTSEKELGDNIKQVLSNPSKPFTRISLQQLENSQINWSYFQISQPKNKTFTIKETTASYFTAANEVMLLKSRHKARPHQQAAISDILSGLQNAERGKLIMACGTGKTFTALKIAEQQAGAGKSVLFLVPSLSLLSQTLTEWSQHSEIPIIAFAVCSDSEVGKRRSKADEESDKIPMALYELAYPATTNAKSLAKQYMARQQENSMTVIFSTYHSIDVIRQAQQQGLPEFNLVICDEAHRTTGQTWDNEDESAFVRIHDNKIIKAQKRLYMTATPRIYKEEAKEKQTQDNLVLYSMDDEAIYGKNLHVLTFSAAVEKELLVPYKVIVLTIEEKEVDELLHEYLIGQSAVESIPVNDAAKIVGCFKALTKQHLIDLTDDQNPMQRAVAFCQIIGEDSKGQPIKTSKTAARHVAKTFADVVAEYQNNARDDEKVGFECEVDYVHGGMGAATKNEKLSWLKQPLANNQCRILTNVRCLSEGVDVPALDAVLFLTPRNSQVDVVQSVGRVMRKAPGKKRGYIILPVVIPYHKEPHKALNDNKTYKVVWQVLQALRSHDDEFDRFINRIELLGSDPQKMEVVALAGLASRKSKQDRAQREQARQVKAARGQNTLGKPEQSTPPEAQQGELPLPASGELERAILAKVVQKVGNRDYWEQWAQDIARLAQMQINRISQIIENPENQSARAAFKDFSEQLHQHINTSIGKAEIIEMLAQHLITRPVFDALFGGNAFSQNNPISAALQAVTDILLKEFHLDKEQQSLQKFYDYIRKKTEDIHDPKARQTLIITLYDEFFASAFPRIVQKHGIVYTPVEIVDFILHSVAYVLKTEFNKCLSDNEVQVLDPFTGTGTFIARLLTSGLIEPDKLSTVYQNQLHANEILLLPYYIAAVNIESTYQQCCPRQPYTPFPGILLADTFNIPTEKPRDMVEQLEQNALAANSERRRKQMESKITVIVGNPPYSVGQKSEMDNNKNVRYPELDGRIETTYAANSNAASKKSLYDSYIRSIRWASDRIDKKTGGIIGFVTNAGWLDSAACDGLRKCLAEDFSNLYIFHLRGDIKSEIRGNVKDKKEGGNVFGQGSTTGVAISILVKQPALQTTLAPNPSPASGRRELISAHSDAPLPSIGEGLGARASGKIHFFDVGDYLTREEKLNKITELGSIAGIENNNLWKNLGG